jgi:hypothetical protein
MLRKVTLELTVLDYDRIGGSDPIGKVLLGYSRKKLEKKHWDRSYKNFISAENVSDKCSSSN